MSDKSCYVTIVNNSQATMDVDSYPIKHGTYIVYPPNSILPGASATFVLSMSSLIYGPAGTCIYNLTIISGTMVSTGKIEFEFGCGNNGPNNANASWKKTLNGVEVQMIPNPLPQYDSPMRVQFILETV